VGVVPSGAVVVIVAAAADDDDDDDDEGAEVLLLLLLSRVVGSEVVVGDWDGEVIDSSGSESESSEMDCELGLLG
jgi:hypothetical protein